MKGVVRILVSLLCCTEAFSQAQSPRSFHFPEGTTSRDYASDQIVVKFKLKPSTSTQQTLSILRTKQPLLDKMGLKRMLQAFPGKVAPANVVTSQNLAALSLSSNGQTKQASPNLSRIYRLQFDKVTQANTAQHLEQVINQLLSDPEVEYAEPVYYYESLAPNENLADAADNRSHSLKYGTAYQPNDAKLVNQYHLNTIRAYDAWQVETGNPNVTIGISDYGFSILHEDLKDNLQYNLADPINGVDDDEDGYIDNYAGWDLSDNDYVLNGETHGSSVSGLAAASTDNRKGIAGIGFQCRFLPAKVNGTGGFRGYESIIYLADHGCKVINMSWGRRGAPSAYEEDIINYAALQKDVVLVAAAGNDGSAAYFYPASYSNVLSVAATNANDVKWSGSNYNDKVDICAPGEKIFTVTANDYATIGSGTSFASPMVAGAAALVRSRYPQLSADQVRMLLTKTTDKINTLNSAYTGKLGSGRLNIYRALTEGYQRVVKLVDFGLVKSESGAKKSNTASVWVQVTCKSAQLNNLVATLSTTSPYIQVSKDTTHLGAIALAGLKDNRLHAFQVLISPDAPADSLAEFRLTYKDGNLVETESFRVVFNPSYQVLQNNLISLALTNEGSIGFESNRSLTSARQEGFRYKGQDLLAGAGLMLGINTTQVSNNVVDNAKAQNVNEKLITFSSLQDLRTVQVANKDVAMAGSFSDTLNNPEKIGLEVEYNPYTWNDGKYVIIEYHVKNVSGATIEHLQAGLYANWDVQGATNNQTGLDIANQLGYIYNRQQDGLYAGVQLLTDQTFNYVGLDNTHQSPVQPFDGFTTAEKYQAMSAGITYSQTTAEATDVAHTLAATLNNIQEGETRVVAFAMLVGDNLADLQANAAMARRKFVDLKRSPLPAVISQAVCRDTPFVISPANGTNFRLYKALPLTKPLAEGALFQLTSTDTEATYYVTNTDSLFESQPVAVHIQPYRTLVEVSSTEINLDSAQTLRLTDHTPGAVWRKWDLGDGTIVHDLTAVDHAYAEVGKYTVQLTTLNAMGCEDTFKQLVYVEAPVGISVKLEQKPHQFIRLYPNPTEGVVYIETPDEKEASAARLFDAFGRQITLPVSPTDQANLYKVDLSSQVAGFYQLQVQIGGKWVIRNMIVR
ncbi:MAG: S8 family serine peptidase [Bacteroidota bacterium]